MMVEPVDAQPVGEFFRRVADPDIFIGGGSVAAIAAAGAASTALLVLRLNERRRSNQDRRDAVRAAIVQIEALVDDFYAAAAADIAILDELLAAQRGLKAGDDQAAYRSALIRAAESPIGMAERIAELLDVVAGQLELATRFTVSDLGAAAVIAEGACRGALLTAEVNIALLRGTAGTQPDIPQSLERRRRELRERVVARSLTIEEATRWMIGASETGEARR
jgi:glutamate formiminotransferase/formiminotetrahydrofolate cyclodeaminase